ncbi:MAG: hypothetical protein HC827_04125 [Cyanobacteria bacterium RM1_2_2]|nr:hypothetical protein [Cyanobacteria bacterium RM1_2_2]
MNPLKLLALTTLLTFAIATPAQTQAESSQPEELIGDPAQAPAQTDLSQTVEPLPPDLAEPLEVGQPEADEFFAPPRNPLPVETQPDSAVDPERLIEPPPGTQTPGQLTPENRLSIPIQ